MNEDTKKFNILVIEDNPGDYLLVEDYLLEHIPHPAIIHAVNFSQASTHLFTEKTSFDVILLDLHLPDKSRQELVTEILKISSFCPVIILTGYSDIEFSISSVSQGISDYLLKDELSAASLYKSISYCIQRRKQVQAITESEKRYSDLFNLSPQPMWLFDPETFRFVQVNKAAIEHFGYTEKEFLAMTTMEIGAKNKIMEDKDGVTIDSEEHEGVFKNRLKLSKKSGEWIDVETTSNTITVNNKLFTSVIAIDVTEKIRFEYRLTRAIIKTQEDERSEIGAELHDNVCQILASSLLTLSMLEESLDPPSFDMFNRSREYITLATVEIRNLSHRLAPGFFNETSLEEAFDRLMQSFNVQKKFRFSLHFDKAAKKSVLGRDLQLNLYRILQEQLNNILKHARASVIAVDVVVEGPNLRLQITDNGIGFNVKAVKDGIGLSNMKRRSELFLGNAMISSSAGNGCTLTVNIPLEKSKKGKVVKTRAPGRVREGLENNMAGLSDCI